MSTQHQCSAFTASLAFLDMTSIADRTAACEPVTTAGAPAFPGPWLAAASMILGPLAMLAGLLVRAGVNFFFPDQLAAFADDPTRMRVAYALFLAGTIALFPGVIHLVQQISRQRPLLAVWGGTLVILGLFARTFHYGANQVLFVAADAYGVEQAVRLVGDVYSTREWVVASLTGAILSGWVVLAVGTFLAKVMHPVRCLGLLAMAALMIGILKGTDVVSIIAVSGLALALVPQGVITLRTARRPERRSVIISLSVLVVVAPLLIIVGQLG